MQVVVEVDAVLPAAETAPPWTNRTRWLMHDTIGSKSVIILAWIRGLISHRFEE